MSNEEVLQIDLLDKQISQSVEKENWREKTAENNWNFKFYLNPYTKLIEILKI